MKLPAVKSLNWSVFAAMFALCGSARSEDWKLYRYEGRDYVSLNNLASFYAFPAPPPIPNAPPPEAARSAPPPSADAPAPIAEPTPAAAPAPAALKTVVLDNDKNRIAVTVNGREAEINGVKQWLAFPAIVQDGKLLISRLDLSKTIEPRLRPERVAGLRPVTTVVLDPGHGGHDLGARSPFGFEKDFALDVATRAREMLEQRGFKVVMTRSADIFIPLHDRPAVANRIPNSIFVAIHFNSTSTNPDAKGFEIYSIAPRGAPATNDGTFSVRDLREEPGNAVDTQSSVLAASIFHSMLGKSPLEDRGIKNARFAVLRLCTQPAVLIEGGFVSNTEEARTISTPAWRAKFAEAIVTGIQNYKEVAEQHHAPKLVADYRRAESQEMTLQNGQPSQAQPPPAQTSTPQ